MQSVAHQTSRSAAQLTGALHKLCLIDGQNLRYVHDASLRKVGFALLQKHVARCVRSAEIRRNQAHHASCYSASVEDIVLDNHARMLLRGRRTSSRSEIQPVHFPLPDLAHQRSFTVLRTLALIRFSRRFSTGCMPFSYTSFSR